MRECVNPTEPVTDEKTERRLDDTERIPEPDSELVVKFI